MSTGSGILAQDRGSSASCSPTASARPPRRSRREWGAARCRFNRWYERSRRCLTPDWESLRGETVSRLQTIIRFDTTNPPGNELPLALYLEAELGKEGIETTLF